MQYTDDTEWRPPIKRKRAPRVPRQRLVSPDAPSAGTVPFARPRSVTLTLRYPHRVNSIMYGGTVTVSPDLADVLREQEQRHAEEDRSVHDPNPPAHVFVGATRQVLNVDASRLDAILGDNRLAFDLRNYGGA